MFKKGTIDKNEAKIRQLKEIKQLGLQLNEWKTITIVFGKWNNNKAFDTWNNKGNIFLESTGIKLDFKGCNLVYWKNNWLIKNWKILIKGYV